MLFKNLDKWAENNNMPSIPQERESKLGRVVDKTQPSLNTQQSPPMMYRAQVAGRCNIQFAGDNNDLSQWKEEWVLPQNNRPSYQYLYRELDVDSPNNLTHSIKLKFPYRVLSNSGQDSILRPVLTTHGIPFISGSSIKGIFKRLIKDKPEDSPDRNLISQYCGTEEVPGILRFHGAYPIGDWSNQMVDIVHPQQSKQVIGNRPKEIDTTARPRPVRQEKNNESTSAYTLISFYEPEFVFEFSSLNFDVDWQTVERILREALTIGLGGKTSTGYGFLDKPNYTKPGLELYQEALHVSFKGRGVASTLLNRQPEFRPNMFKAALRGHMMRLLSGVCNSEDMVTQNINSLLGDTDKEGSIKLFWESISNPSFVEHTNPKTYTTEGILHIYTDSKANSDDINFIAKVLQFAYIMGGFGKSWRRIAHEKFYPEYLRPPENGRRKPDIGCHWESKSEWINFEDYLNVNSEDTLRSFLRNLHRSCLDRLGSRPPASISNWREAWQPDRVAVYSKVVTQSQAVKLFHQEPFKYTPAIGGRKREGQPTSVSHVWHRMLPVNNSEYLEIVTIFRQPHQNWIHQIEGDMHDRFIQQLTDRDFKLVEWGR